MPQSKTLYTPIFHAPVPKDQATPSSSISTVDATLPHPLAILSKRHLLLASLPADYSPPPSPPLDPIRLDALRDKVVPQGVRMGCVRNGYKRVALLRPRDGNVERGKPREWILPETEEEWFRWEKEGERVDVKEKVEHWKAGMGSTPDKVVTSSLEAYICGEGKDGGVGVDGAAEAEVEVVADAEVVAVTLVKEKEKTKAKSSHTKDQPQLGFAVVKRRTLAAPVQTKKSRGRPRKQPLGKTAPVVPQSSPPGVLTSSPPDVPKDDKLAPAIVLADGADKSFDANFPPSFPNDLPTSTQLPAKPSSIAVTKSPPQTKKRVRPMTPPPDSPHDADSERDEPSVPQPLKKARTTEDFASSTHHEEKENEREVELSRAGTYTPPRSITPTPPGFMFIGRNKDNIKNKDTQPNVTAVARASTPKPALGNAIGLPIPSTPNPLQSVATPEKRPLPTLTELLASSRRSRPRPRPPSRKRVRTAREDVRNEPADEQHERGMTPVQDILPPIEPNTPTKSYFSSPASDTFSDQLIRISPRSPLDFRIGATENTFTPFVPDHVSTQLPMYHYAGSGSVVQGGMEKGSSGSGGGFYYGASSQVFEADVDAQVDRVSELLERDVDFDGWLRDISGDEAEGGEGASEAK